MIEVERTARVYKETAAELWERIRDFQRMHTWHPGVADTEARGENVRMITLADGSTAIETMTDEGDLHHTYRIDESELPVKNFQATLLVRELTDDPDSSEIVWTAQFDAHGAEDADAQEIVEGIFDAGLRSLREED